MATLQIRVNDELKSQADELFASLGLDVATAIRIFLTVSIERNGLPFDVRHKPLPEDLREAVYETRNRVNLSGPFKTVKEAYDAMTED